MIKRITVPIKLEYTDESPIIREQTVLAWVCGGFALHKTIQCDMQTGIFAKGFWCITHVNSKRAIVPFGSHKLVALRYFADLQDVSVDGVRLGDMTYEQTQAYQKELRFKLQPILYPNMRFVGSHGTEWRIS